MTLVVELSSSMEKSMARHMGEATRLISAPTIQANVLTSAAQYSQTESVMPFSSEWVNQLLR